MGISLGVRKKSDGKKNKKRLLRSIVSYLKSDPYLFAPLFSSSSLSNSESSKAEDISMAAGFEALGIERIKKKRKRRVSEKVKEYLKYDNHMYGPIISPPKLDSSLKGKLQFTNLVTMEVSTSTTTITEDNNLRSEIAEQTLQNGKLDSPRRQLVILEGQSTGLSSEGDLSPAFSSLPEEKVVKPDRKRVTIK